MDKYIGKRLDGRYEVQAMIGMGGMSNVYRAVDVLEQKIVAVKILRDEFLTNEEFVRRFKNESKTIAILSHPNIVKVFDVSFSDQYQFIVMEYVDGITLKEYISQQSPIHWKEVVHFTVEILQALQHAHAKGVVHRDVKPQNIMLLQDGRIKVMDFGIARFARSETRATSEKAIGSVHYISPEQARGEHTGPPTDLYSVGVMMFEMLTGQLPFEADTPVSVAIKHISSSPIRPREINPTIPEGLEEIVIRAMQKDPNRRYQSAEEMLRDIELFKKNPSIQFEYQYVQTNNANYLQKINRKVEEEKSVASTKGDELVAKRQTPQKRNRREVLPQNRRTRTQVKNYDPYDDYIDDEDYYEEEKEKSILVPIMIAVGAAFALVALIVVIVTFMINDPFSGGEQKAVPDLVGLSYEDIVDDAQYKTYTIQQEAYDYTENFNEGQIFEQDPKPGTMTKDTIIIKVKVSRGIQSQKMPELTGKSKADAKTTLEALGLSVKFQEVYDENVSKGNVVRTDPLSGSDYQAGGSVTVYISKGPAAKTVKVPSIIGLADQQAAKDALEAEGLKLGTVKTVASELPEGAIVTQDPAAGTEVDSNTVVNIEVSDGKSATVDFRQNISMPSSTKAYVCTVIVDDVEYYSKNIVPADQGSITIDCKVKEGSTISVYFDGQLFKTYLVQPDGNGGLKSKMMIDNSFDF